MFRQPKITSSGSSQTTSSTGGRKVVIRAQSETCRYPNRVCSQPVLDQYDYCLKHILEDKNAPYKPCGYTYAINNKRCLQPAPRGDKRDIGYCTTHLWKTQMKRQKAMTKHIPPVTTEALLSGLSHYVRPMRNVNKVEIDDSPNPTATRAINPFIEADVSKASLCRTHVLECASESDSDVEPANLDNVWRANNEDSSDAESIDSQIDDPLRHAGIYTAEEVILMTRNKVLRLQKLYQRQFERLAHVLKERRRKYLHALKKEKETLSTISDQIHNPKSSNPKEQKLYEKLKALNRYQKKSNAETIAHLASMEKRAKEIGGPNYKPQGHSTKCTFTEGGVRCSRVTLPLTKFCFKHILDDPNQSIFRACGCEKADTICQDPVTGLCSGDTCVLHIKLPTLPHLNLPNESNKLVEQEKVKSTDNESELDASATESAFSTDNHESPEAPLEEMSPISKKTCLYEAKPFKVGDIVDNNVSILEKTEEEEINNSKGPQDDIKLITCAEGEMEVDKEQIAEPQT